MTLYFLRKKCEVRLNPFFIFSLLLSFLTEEFKKQSCKQSPKPYKINRKNKPVLLVDICITQCI